MRSYTILAALAFLTPAVVSPVCAQTSDAPVEVRAPAGTGSIGFAYEYTDTIVWQSGTTPRPRRHPRVKALQPGGPAERARLRVGDVLLAVNGRDARQPRLFPDLRPGTRYVLRIRRGDEEREIVLHIGAPAN